MMRSMFSGVSALRNHQTMMDVIGNNIANVNTVGFKGSRAIFQEALNQTLESASAPGSGRGGTNPRQVGLGVSLGAISNYHTPGNLQSSGSATDLAIEGNGYFVVGSGDQRFFTRAGAFDFEEGGSLVNITNGMYVYGWQGKDGAVDTKQPVSTLRIPSDQMIAPMATDRIEYSGNLDARTTGALAYAGEPMVLSDGTNEISVSFELTPTGSYNEWFWRADVTGGSVVDANDNPSGSMAFGTVRLGPDGEVTYQSVSDNIRIQPDGSNDVIEIEPPQVGTANGGTFSLGSTGNFTAIDGTGLNQGNFTAPAADLATIHVFDSQGARHDVIVSFERTSLHEWAWSAEDRLGNPVGGGSVRFGSDGVFESQTGSIVLTPTGVDALHIEPDFSTLTQFASPTTAEAVDQNGFAAGTLSDVTVDALGRVVGSFSNGLEQVLGQVALATFRNPGGLHKEDGSLFRESANSGMANVGVAGTGNRGGIAPGNLEMSNVDLGMEFTHMIITQRGYQANSRIITTSDEMLQELVNLKR